MNDSLEFSNSRSTTKNIAYNEIPFRIFYPALSHFHISDRTDRFRNRELLERTAHSGLK